MNLLSTFYVELLYFELSINLDFRRQIWCEKKRWKFVFSSAPGLYFTGLQLWCYFTEIVVGSRKNHPVNAKLKIRTINKFCITILVRLHINENKSLKVCTNNKRDKNSNTLFQTTRNIYTIVTGKKCLFLEWGLPLVLLPYCCLINK